MSVLLGQRVRCLVTGFTGIVIGRTEYLNGCLRIGVAPPVDKDGKAVDAIWIDEPQLEILEAEPAYKAVGERLNTGGPAPSIPMRAQDPCR